ncbi:MAG: type II toxin-antitoxin system HicB family antitoxin [Dehalogenimonas sp.]|jgi:hypothetical protein|uniref:Type II toxin-antitoxin system HicB family antitoxin n=1 Tax=Candidatus Dehalogenimonas loeffleri TaxID=3127115 RepID=A0ABZ2JC63_9CHLR|nr:type II toxin-antitoxin system HicB family antitoxin [Dehalogenimonas sp.]
MEKMRFVYYQEDGMLVGWLEEYPDYKTQGESLTELQQNLKAIYDDIGTGSIPCVRKYGELVVG